MSMDSRHRVRPRGRRSGRAAAAAVAAVALAAPLIAAHPAATAPSKTTTVAEKETEEELALASAAENGKPVELLSRRSETAQTFANPDGSFTQDTYATAQFVRKDGKLMPFDTSLKPNADGTFSPRLTGVQVTFSGGGTGPMVTVERDGRSMAWSWPKPLPEPTVNGDSVTYENVLPDVDLKLRAGTAGFGQLLIVRSAKAAAHPDLSTIKLPLAANGLTVKTDPHGNMRAVNPAGQEVFTAPTPMMWDSTPAAARASTATVLSGGGAPPPSTNEFEAPLGARDAAMDVRVDGDELSLTPDPKVLKGPDTTYPVYIDPAVSGAREAWAIVTQAYPKTAYYNGNGWREGDGDTRTDYARVGWPGDTLSRSFFRMDSNNLWNTNKIISQSTFRIKNTHSYSCNDRPVELWLTGSISSSTTWDNQPAWASRLSTVSDSRGYNSSCPAGNLAFDATAAAKNAASSRWNNITLGLRVPPSSEGDKLAYKRFDARTAVLSTTYNSAPNAPTSLDTIPSAGCKTTAPYGLIGNTDVYLTAKVSDPDGGTVQTQFRLWGNNDLSSSAAIFDQTVSATSGTVVKVKVPKTTLAAKEGIAKGVFRWKARTYDGSSYSSWVPGTACGFLFDSTRPSLPPGVSSAQFPDGSNGWPVNTSAVRTAGTFTFTSGGVSDVTKYEYWSDSDGTHRFATPNIAGGNTTVTITPTVVGSNRLYVVSHDKAGNLSDRQTYLFYANGPTVPDKPRDINGSGGADLWAISATGQLTRHFGATDGSLTKASSPASADNFSGAHITHYDDWTGDAFVDLIALQKDTATGTHRLWLYENDGSGGVCATNCAAHPRQELSVYDPGNNHWENGVKQILAIGDLDGPLDVDADGTPDIPGFPDLLVNDGTHLWLYYGAPDNRLDSGRDPLLLAGPDDPIAVGPTTLNGVTLMAVGDFDSNGRNDLGVRFEDPSIGKLFIYWGGEQDGVGMADPAHRGQYAAQYDWSTTTAPLVTAAPAASSNGKIGFWFTRPSSGDLRFLTNFTNPDSTFSVAATDFSGYQRIS
ncbi:VCBS repeat-containing protein [Streptomyces sp. CC228A]|uniref:VCBS repeat-containing protein n=1 Tax=Streptomyces sp. CC228A TaxID=2898186 RepID=UPI001F201543|nr:VCBS repeat-containing protein [Streptomyces sp. CC228A]